MNSPLLDSYRQYGWEAIKHVDEEEMLLDHNFCLDIIPLVVERDDEEAFDFLINNFWGIYYKGLVRTSLKLSTTKYLEKIIHFSGLMLLEEVGSDNYTLEEMEIVVKAYLASMPFAELYNLPGKGVNLTQVLDRLQVDV